MSCHASRERAKGDPTNIVAYKALQIAQGVDNPDKVAEVAKRDIFEMQVFDFKKPTR